MQFIQGFVMVQKIDMYKLHIYNWPMFFELYFHVLCLNECYALFSFIKIKNFIENVICIDIRVHIILLLHLMN